MLDVCINAQILYGREYSEDLLKQISKAQKSIKDVVVDSLKALVANSVLLKPMTWFPLLRVNL